MTELYPELSVQEALERVISHLHVLQSQHVPILEALGLPEDGSPGSKGMSPSLTTMISD